MTPREASVVIGISACQVRMACRKGLLPSELRRKSNKVVEYDIQYKDAMYYRDNRPKRGRKPVRLT